MTFRTIITFATDKPPQTIELLTVLQALSRIPFDALSDLARDLGDATQSFKVTFLTITVEIKEEDDKTD